MKKYEQSILFTQPKFWIQDSGFQVEQLGWEGGHGRRIRVSDLDIRLSVLVPILRRERALFYCHAVLT